MDIYCEYMVKKKRQPKDILIIIALLAAGVLITVFGLFVAAVFASEISFTIYIAVLIAAWYFVYVFITRRNVEYELTFTNGELDVDEIYAKKRRVHILSARVRDFEICAPVDDARFKSQFSNARDLKKIYTAHSHSKTANVYFADFYLNAEKVRLIFEPSRKMIERMKIYNDKKIFIRE